MRLVGNEDPGWNGRGHFFGAAARAMRRILVDIARRKRTANGPRRRTCHNFNYQPCREAACTAAGPPNPGVRRALARSARAKAGVRGLDRGDRPGLAMRRPRTGRRQRSANGPGRRGAQ